MIWAEGLRSPTFRSTGRISWMMKMPVWRRSLRTLGPGSQGAPGARTPEPTGSRGAISYLYRSHRWGWTLRPLSFHLIDFFLLGFLASASVLPWGPPALSSSSWIHQIQECSQGPAARAL